MKQTCPLCQSATAKEVYKSHNLTLLKCGKCELSYLWPMPAPDEIKKFYSQEYFEYEKDSAHAYADYQAMEKSLAKEAWRKINFIRSFTTARMLLDLGCGLGTFLKEAKAKGYKVSGNDISDYAQKTVSTELKVPFYKGSVAQSALPKRHFELVTAWDVFEHIPEISAAFKNVSSTIVENGFLFLTTPNIKSVDSKILGRYWYGYKKIPEHLIFFSPESIRYALENNGFEVLTIKTWGFERDFNFIAQKLKLYNSLVAKIFFGVISALGLRHKSIYLPLTDMMVVARKK